MRTTRLAALLILAAALPSIARGAQVQVTSSTQYLWYQDFQSTKEQRDVAEYLRLNASFGEKDAIKLAAYGRVIGQLSSTVESRPEITNDVIGRLYYLYLDYRDLLPGHLDVTAGRTYLGMAAASALVDGLNLNARNLGLDGLGVRLAGGRRVLLDNRSEVGSGKDSVWGGSVYLDTVKLTHAEVSYAREYAQKDLAREHVALDLSTAPLNLLGLYGRAKYDLVSSRWGEVLAGVKLAPIDTVVVRGELFDSVPTFDKASFYSFFGVERYRQLSAAVEYQPLALIGLHLRYGHETFGAGASADVWEGGVVVRPIEALVVNASFEKRVGYAGKLGGLRLDASYRFGQGAVLAGADYDDFQREASRDGTAKRYWGGLQWDFNKMLGALARIERDSNYRFDSSYQGYLALNVHL